MMGVEGRGARRELPVQGVHNGRIEPRRQRERGEAAVVVDNVEASIRGGSIDLVERSCDVIDLVQRTLDLIWMALAEKRRHSGAGRRSPPTQTTPPVASADEGL